MSNEMFAVLETIARAPDQRILCSQYTEIFPDPHLVLSLKAAGYLERRKENPNLRHLLPESQRDQEFFFLTAAGREAYCSEAEHRQEQQRTRALAEKSFVMSVIAIVIAGMTLLITFLAFLVSLMRG